MRGQCGKPVKARETTTMTAAIRMAIRAGFRWFSPESKLWSGCVALMRVGPLSVAQSTNPALTRTVRALIWIKESVTLTYSGSA